MLTEDYCDFETAKLLKEKGFDEPCYSYYCEDKRFIHGQSIHPIRNISNPCFFGYAAPTQAIVMKWLREVHNIDISIIPLRSHKEYLPRIESDTISHDAIPCKKYEKAAETAIKYCLEHLI